jgi:hypothetical protein
MALGPVLCYICSIMLKKGICVFVSLVILVFSLCAQEEEPEIAAEPEAAGITSSRDLNLLISSLPEAKLVFNQSFTFPFLRGSGPLTADNNIETTLTAELAPVSLNGALEAVLTPIAFLQFSAGARLGTGWNIELLGSPVHGMGLNVPKFGRGAALAAGTGDTYRLSSIDGKPFDGLVYRFHGGGAFQFDLAALLPGDWNHVVFRTYHEANYRAYTRANNGESWVFEADNEENRNGFNYYGSYVLGYQMPIFFNMIGVMAEMNKYLYGVDGSDYWGDDIPNWTFSVLGNFTISKWMSAALIVQCRTMRNFKDGDKNNKYGNSDNGWTHRYYQYREVDRANPLRLEFYRVAAILSFSLK